MTASFPRRRDPQPIGRGWELPTAAAGAALLAVALAALTGLGVASAIFGDGWVWPHGTETVGHVLGGLLRGHPGRGLPADQLHRVPGPAPVYACIAAIELILLATAALVAVLLARYRRPGDARGGMATRREADHALGLGQLRAARALIRPDIYGPQAESRTQAKPPSTAIHRLRIRLWAVHRSAQTTPLVRPVREREHQPGVEASTTRGTAR